MSAYLEWVLIGGPAHGKVLQIHKDSHDVVIEHEGKRYAYQGNNYRVFRHVYRVGLYGEMPKIDIVELICTSGIKPIELKDDLS